MRRQKYNAKPTNIDGIRFASIAESRRYMELKALTHASNASDRITNLVVHPRYALSINGAPVGHYTGDFSYTDPQGRWTVEDVKSEATMTEAAVFRIKVFRALYPQARFVFSGIPSGRKEAA